MNEIAIHIENLSKEYHIRPFISGTTKKSFLNKFRLLNMFIKPSAEEGNAKITHALQNFNLTIRKGEIIGIVGKNGAGKSTLLKLIAEVISPDEGKIEITGSIISILEVGMGFHQELSGRENIFMNGFLLGLSKQQINCCIEKIVEFSGIDNYIDVPIKFYSSGMQMRLAFSVIAFLESDTIILDEALTMGDASFKVKCLKKIEELVRAGKTILMASHELQDIIKFCNRVIYLRDGKLVSDGTAINVISEYLNQSKVDDAFVLENVLPSFKIWNDMQAAPGVDILKIHKVCIHAKNKNIEEPIFTHDPIVLEIEFWKSQENTTIDIGFIVFHHENRILAGGTIDNEKIQNKQTGTGLFSCTCELPSHLFNDSKFVVDILVAQNRQEILFCLSRIISFQICIEKQTTNIIRFKGPIRLTELNWGINKIEALS